MQGGLDLLLHYLEDEMMLVDFLSKQILLVIIIGLNTHDTTMISLTRCPALAIGQIPHHRYWKTHIMNKLDLAINISSQIPTFFEFPYYPSMKLHTSFMLYIWLTEGQ
jgi:hypothetical protein